jgi:HSP20 family molecular chaperone IbpA
MRSKRASHQQQPDPPAALLILCNPEDLRREMQQVQLAMIARRAYELFETRGCEHGHDWEDWLRAESELLQPVSVSMSESTDRISIRADVVGFDERELKVSIEPHRITILGQKEMKAEGVEQTSSYPHQILKVVDLATQVMPERTVVELQGGVLEFELPTAAKNEVDTAPAV